MGLLGQGWDDPQSSAIMALAGGLLRKDFGGGLLRANQAYGEHRANAVKQKLYEAQLAETMAQAEERKMNVARQQEAMRRQQAMQQALPSLFRQPGMTGGAPVPQTEGGVPMFSRPMGAGPMQATPGGFDVQRAIELGMDPKMIQEYAGLQDLGRPKATRQMEVDDGKGGKRIALVDDFGREVAGFAGYTAPVQVNQGDRVSFVRPAPGVTLPMHMSPEARASNALGWANNALTRRGQDRTDQRSRETSLAGRIPAGYRVAANGQGLEFIPGGPADPNAAKKAAPTEFQGKAAMFGSRAAEADRIITELDGKYSPAAINTKKALGDVWAVGGALESAGNAALPANAQKAEQAERDFVNAVLRLESGAAIGKDEFENARKQYFPQPFDSAQVKAQKAANRKRAIQGLQDNARTSSAQQAPNTGGATGSFDTDNDPLGLRK